MDSARLQRIQSLFLSAAELSGLEHQQAFLESECNGDAELKSEAMAMLRADRETDSLLDRDIADAAHCIFDGSRTADLISRKLGPYRVTKFLGEGGMGVVYLGERADLGRFDAIKILRDAWLSPARRKRFLIEQRMLAHLNHPSIAQIYDADTLEDGTPWFAMEFVDGIPITEYCRAHECPIDESLRLFKSTCEAVRFAHEHAVIHRDLKPSNILVKPDGAVKLLDFGIAKQLQNSDRPVDQTRAELRLMTPAYAAPEQMRGEQVGGFTDVYALGLILYELLTDALPFAVTNKTPEEAARMVLTQEPDPPSVAGRRRHLSKAVWADLDVLCLTAIHKDVQRRYRSVEALIRDVDRYLHGQPLEARGDTAGYRLGKFIRRHRRSVTAGALAGIILIGMTVFFTVRLARARNTALTAVARMGRVQEFMLNLFQGGDKSVGPAADLRVVSILDRGVKEARTLQGEPEVQAELYLTLGDIYEKLGNLPEADVLLNSALAQRKSLFGPEHPEVAESLVDLGLLRVDQARFDEAERLIRQGLEQINRKRPRDDNAVARATGALGKVLATRGSYDKAIPLLEEAVRLQSGSGAPPLDLAASLKELADAEFYAGHRDVCESLTQRALSIHRRLLGDRHPLVADDLINLGAVQFEEGRYVQADGLYRQAFDINLNWYGHDHPETASTLSMLARALVFEDRYDEGMKLAEEALAIQERVFGANHPRVANVLNELGEVALQHDRFDEAEARFARMAAIYKSAYGEHHYLYAVARANLASVYLARGQYVRAEQMFREVVKLYSAALSPQDLNTGIAQIKLGRALVDQKRYSEAEEHTLAGYNILISKTSPSVSWLRAARKDLIKIYEAMNQPEKAAPFRK